jgi:hypothetical protein
MLGPATTPTSEIDAPGGIDTWSVATNSPVDVVVVRLIGGERRRRRRARSRLVCPATSCVALLTPPRGGQYSIARGRAQATWTLEFKLADGEPAPVRYRLVVERPSALGSRRDSMRRPCCAHGA